MKKAIIVLMLLLFSCSALAAYEVNAPNLKITLISQEPSAAQPGEVITLKFKIENNGTATNEDAVVELLSEFPFSIYSGNGKINIGKLQAGQTGADAVIVEFKVKADEQAVEGTEKIDLRVLANGVWKLFEDFSVKIETRDTTLSIESMETEPANIEPGTDFKLKVMLANNADSIMRNVKLTLNLNSSSVPFAPLKSTSERYVYQISPKSGRQMTFDMTALPNAEGGTYKVPLTISFVDGSGKSYTNSDLISLKISSQPDLLVSIENYKQESSEVTVKIVNRGLTDIKLMSARVTPSDNVELLASDEIYIGNIDSDDYETAVYRLKVNSYDKTVEIPLTLNYKDAVNAKQELQVTLKLITGSKGLLVTILSGAFKAVVYLAIFGAIGYLGYWFYKRRR